MNLTGIFRSYLPYFHYLGMIEYSFGSYRLAWKMPGMGFVLFAIVAKVIGCVGVILTSSEWKGGDRILSTFFSVFATLQVVSVFVNFVFRSHLLSETNDLLLSVEGLFVKDLHLNPIPYEKFKKNFFWRVLLIFVAYFQGVISALIFISAHSPNFYMYLSILTQFFLTGIACSAVFYLELVSFYLQLLNTSIERDSNGCGGQWSRNNTLGSKMKKKLRVFKMIQFFLWKAVQRINDYFGWTLIPFILQLFMMEFYSIYWLVTALQENPRPDDWELQRKCD